MLICFDVDGTLFTFDKRPIPRVVATLRFFHDIGCSVHVWSGAGKDYAQWAAEALNIADIVTCSKKGEIKPDITFDDDTVDYGHINLKIPVSYQIL